MITTVQTYTCPVHGRYTATVHGDVPDTWPCAIGTDDAPCIYPGRWTPSAPAVHIPGNALRSHVRDTNPW